MIDEIGRGHRDLAVVGIGQLARGSMEIHRQLARGFGVEQLREPGAEHSGEHVAGAAGRHPGDPVGLTNTF